MQDEAKSYNTARWLAYALEDLAAAQAGLTNKEMVSRHICSFAQQAAEKAMKSGFIWMEIDVIRTHDIFFIQQKLPTTWQIHLIPEQELASLTSWAVGSRYPGEEQDPSEEDAKTAVSIAQDVCRAMLADLATAGYIGVSPSAT